MLEKIKGSTLISGSVVYLTSNMLNAIIPFALLPILTRYLSQEEYGQVAMFQTLIVGLSAVTGLSVHGAVSRKFYDQGASDRIIGDYIAACLQILAVTTMLVALAIAIFGQWLSDWLGLEFWHILVSVVVSGSSFICLIRMGQWQVRLKAKNFGSFQVSRSLLDIGLSLVLVVIFLQGVDGRIIGQSVAMVVFALFGLFFLHRDRLLKFFVWRPDYTKEALRFGVPLIPHIVGGFLLTAADRFVINAELGLDQAGIYMVAFQISMGMNILFTAINQAYVPWLFERLKNSNKEIERKIVQNTYKYFGVLLLVAIASFIIGPPVIVVVAGDSYAGAGQVIGWLCLGQIFSGMYLMVTNYIFYSKRTGALAVATLFSGFLNLLLMLSLVTILGIKGAAISFAIACAIKFFLTWWLANIRHPMPWFEFKTLFARNKV